MRIRFSPLQYFALFLCGAVLLVGIYSLAMGIWSHGWDKTEATILWEKGRMAYAYQYGGLEYLGSRVGYGQEEDQTDYSEWVRKYPTGSRQVIWVNPWFPSCSVMKQGVGSGWWLGFFVPLGIAAILWGIAFCAAWKAEEIRE